MKQILFAAVLCLGFMPTHGFADDTILPFDVSIGGHKAVLKNKDAIFATIDTAVAADAEMQIHDETKNIIVNIFPCDAKGKPKSGASPTIILIQGGNKAKLDQSFQKTKLAAGTYLANVINSGKTARVLFTVE